MLYVDFLAGNETYKLRLATRAIMTLEKQLGCNPLSIFGDGTVIPTVTTMITILHASLQQYQHGITLEKAADIFDTWLADGHNMTEFITIILEIYKSSGLISNEKN